MYIEKLKLRDFRNYKWAELEFSPLTNIIYGDNAQGKTNILEAVYLFSQGRSHRAKTDKELVRFGCGFAGLEIDFCDAHRSYNGKMQITDNGRKAVRINHINIGKLSQLMNYLNVVMFSPEDLKLVKGSPGNRRRFMDSAISQMYPSYLSALLDYNKILNQKNSLLKTLKYKGGDFATLEIWNGELARNMVKIMDARQEFISDINGWAKGIQNEISKEELELSYVPNIRLADNSEAEIFEFLTSRSSREIDAGGALYGVQRDDINIHINGNDAKLYASQGQQRTSALSMKIAQSEYINEKKGEYPILLLDDIMSELDVSRRMYLSERIKDKQVLITSTDTDIKNNSSQTKLFRIKNGEIL